MGNTKTQVTVKPEYVKPLSELANNNFRSMSAEANVAIREHIKPKRNRKHKP